MDHRHKTFKPNNNNVRHYHSNIANNSNYNWHIISTFVKVNKLISKWINKLIKWYYQFKKNPLWRVGKGLILCSEKTIDKAYNAVGYDNHVGGIVKLWNCGVR